MTHKKWIRRGQS